MSVNLVSIYCFLDQLNAHFAENNLTKKKCKNIACRGLALFFNYWISNNFWKQIE